MTLKYTFLIIALITTTHANTLGTPCTNRTCDHVFSGDGNETASGSISLSGSNDDILSDISPPAGWHITECSSNRDNGTENIHMVCTGTPQQMSHCDHLYSNGGAENTVVRLPQNCGAGPFARVQSTFVPSNQSVPPNIPVANSTSPNVKGLILDYNFAAIPPSRGKISLAIRSSTNQTAPLTRRDIAHLVKRDRAGPVERRFGFNPAGAFKTVANGAKSAGDAITSAGNAVTSVGGDITSAAATVATVATSVAATVATVATSAVASVATSAASQAASVATSVASEVTSVAASAATVVATAAVNGANDIKNATTFNEAQKSGPIPFNLQSTFPMFNGQINCGVSVAPASLKISVDANVTLVITIDYEFEGSLVPPDIRAFSLSSSLNGGVAARYHIQSQSQGPFDTGSLELFRQGLPGLNVPGIVSVGPEITINGEVSLASSLELDMTVTTGFAYDQLQMDFPPNSAKRVGSAQPQNSPNDVKLSVSPVPSNINNTIKGTLSPRIDFGITIGNIAQASVFLNSDITGVVNLSFQGSNNTAISQTTLGSNSTSDGSGADTLPPSINPSAGNATDPLSASVAPSSIDTSTSSPAAPSTVTSSTPSIATSSAPSTIPSSAPPAVVSPPRPVAFGTLLLRSTDVNGCVHVNGAINITGGLTGSLPPLFNEAQTFPIFSTSGVLFNKCFGNGAPAAAAPAITQRSVLGGSPAARAYKIAQVERREPAAKASTSSPVKRKNEITPQVSKASTSLLSCLPQSLSPLNQLQSLI